MKTSSTPSAFSQLPAAVDPVVIGAAVCALLALIVMLWQYWENHSSGPPLRAVVTDLVGTGDPGLDGALDRVLRVDLSQSPFLTVVSPNPARSRQPAGALLTLPMARAVCEDAAAQVVLQPAVSKLGDHYSITLTARRCSGDRVLAQTKQDVARLDDLPDALGLVATDMRRALGESRGSLRHFDEPWRVGSLAALQAYSEGLRLASQGDGLGALPLLQHSIELDARLAPAYFALATDSIGLKDMARARAAATKAYELRETLPRVQQFEIAALYYNVVTGDSVRSIENYNTWARLYPRSAEAFARLADAYDSLGEAKSAVAPAQRAVQLRPNDAEVYQTLARAQLHSGQLQAAQRTCELSIAKHFDGDTVRDILLQTLYSLNDHGGVAIQLQWGEQHPDSVRMHLDAVAVALARGELQHARTLLGALRARQYPPDLIEDYQAGLARLARALAELDLSADSRELLESLGAAALQYRDALVALAETGDVTRATQGLQQLAGAHGQEALWKNERLPEIRAALALAEHRSQQALSALAPASSFDGSTFGPAYLGGRAYAALGKLTQAQAEFQKITEHDYVEPLSSEYPLALLASARAYVSQHDVNKARAQLTRLFALWKTGDADAPLLLAAHQDYENSAPMMISVD